MSKVNLIIGRPEEDGTVCFGCVPPQNKPSTGNPQPPSRSAARWIQAAALISRARLAPLNPCNRCFWARSNPASICAPGRALPCPARFTEQQQIWSAQGPGVLSTLIESAPTAYLPAQRRRRTSPPGRDAAQTHSGTHSGTCIRPARTARLAGATGPGRGAYAMTRWRRAVISCTKACAYARSLSDSILSAVCAGFRSRADRRPALRLDTVIYIAY